MVKVTGQLGISIAMNKLREGKVIEAYEILDDVLVDMNEDKLKDKKE